MAVSVIRFGAMGDQVMLTPLLRGLAQRSGERITLYASGGWSRPLMAAAPWVDEVVTIQSRNSPYWIRPDQWELVRKLRENDGPIWLCEDDEKTKFFLRRAKIDLARIAYQPITEGQHACDRWFAAARLDAAGTESWQALAADAGPHSELIVDLQHRQECEAWLQQAGWNDRPIIAVQAGNKRTMRRGSRTRSGNVKYWPEERWAQVIDQLLEQHPTAQVLLCGAPMEQGLALDIQGMVQQKDRVAAVADQLPIPRLLALLQRSLGCLSVDTGPAHAAAAVGCALTVLFGATDARLFRPRSARSPVEIVSVVAMDAVAPGKEAWKAANSMDGITVDAAVAGWQRMLQAV